MSADRCRVAAAEVAEVAAKAAGLGRVGEVMEDAGVVEETGATGAGAGAMLGSMWRSTSSSTQSYSGT